MQTLSLNSYHKVFNIPLKKGIIIPYCCEIQPGFCSVKSKDGILEEFSCSIKRVSRVAVKDLTKAELDFELFNSPTDCESFFNSIGYSTTLESIVTVVELFPDLRAGYYWIKLEDSSYWVVAFYANYKWQYFNYSIGTKTTTSKPAEIGPYVFPPSSGKGPSVFKG
jgi:hypothetical protein